MELHKTVCAVVREGDKFLLVKRNNRPEKGCWAFPAGHVDPGETPLQAVKRESMEEVGPVEITPKPVWVFTHDIGVGKRHKASVYLGKPAGKLRPGSDAEALGWFTPDQMKKMDITIYTLQILNRLYGSGL